MTNYALRVPESLFAYARKVAEEEQAERQARSELNAFDTWLNASPDAEPMKGDELV